MFERQIEAYEILRKKHMQRVTSRMNRDDLKEYNEVLIAYKHPDAQAGEYPIRIWLQEIRCLATMSN